MPLVSVTASGGARMQEGILSLMQLPKTVCAVEDLHDARCALINVFAHPTTAGVLASFASLGDVTVAEPGALISFTGPRVVQQTTREKLPDDFGLAESNLRFGHLDAIVPRPELRPYLGAPPPALRQWPGEAERRLRERLARLRNLSLLGGAKLSGELERLQRQLEQLEAEPTDEEIWRSVELARHPERPYTLDYVERHARRLGRAARRPRPRRRRRDGRRARAASTAARSCSSASRRAATSRSGRSASSGCPTRRATGRRCARWSSPTATASR